MQKDRDVVNSNGYGHSRLQQDSDSEGFYYELLLEYMGGDKAMKRDARHKLNSNINFVSSNVYSSLVNWGPMLRFPSEIDAEPLNLVDIIRREFRVPENDHAYTVEARMSCGFHALSEINKKLVWYESMATPISGNNSSCIKKANGVEQIRQENMFQPGAYLVAHPLQTGYFAKTVIVILDHSYEGGTYGLIVNRSKEKTFQELLQVDHMPKPLVESFGNNKMRDGGPVHVSVQMMYSCTADEEAEYVLEGSVLPYAVPLKTTSTTTTSVISHRGDIGGDVQSHLPNNEHTTELSRPVSTALHSDKAIFFRGNVGRASELVLQQLSNNDKQTIEHAGANRRKLTSSDFVFFSGSSVWESGQLESEMGHGFWLPCAGPPSIALSGKCTVSDGTEVEGEDLWIAMMGAAGKNEAALATLLANDNEGAKYGLPSDEI